MKEQILESIKESKRIIREQQQLILNIRNEMRENNAIKVGDKVSVHFFDWNGNEDGEPKLAFIGAVNCSERLEISYNFLAIKKDGKPSKNSAGIRSNRIKVELSI